MTVFIATHYTMLLGKFYDTILRNQNPINYNGYVDTKIENVDQNF